MPAKFPATQYTGENKNKKTFPLTKATQSNTQYSTNSVHLHLVGSSNSTLTLLQSAAVHPPSWLQDCTILDRKHTTVMLDWLLLTDNYHFAAYVYVGTHPKYIQSSNQKALMLWHHCLVRVRRQTGPHNTTS